MIIIRVSFDEALPLLVLPGVVFVSVLSVMPLRENKRCHICDKNISASNFARHRNLHVFCHSCGIWTTKNKHQHTDIFSQQETLNFVQVWMPILIPSQFLPTPAPTQSPSREEEDLLAEYFTKLSPTEQIERELRTILVDIPSLEAEVLSINFENVWFHHPEFCNLDKEVSKREVFAKLGRSDAIENEF